MDFISQTEKWTFLNSRWRGGGEGKVRLMRMITTIVAHGTVMQWLCNWVNIIFLIKASKNMTPALWMKKKKLLVLTSFPMRWVEGWGLNSQGLLTQSPLQLPNSYAFEFCLFTKHSEQFVRASYRPWAVCFPVVTFITHVFMRHNSTGVYWTFHFPILCYLKNVEQSY